MRPQSVNKVVILHLLTLGIYFIVWCKRSKDELNPQLASHKIPSTWLLLVPIANYLWAWIYASAVHTITKGKVNATNIYAYWIVAHIVFLVGFTFFIDPSWFTEDESLILFWTIVEFATIIIVGILVLCLFPALMQKQFNKLASKTQKPRPTSSHSR